ncbi:unnamed protein product [Allacma fusca]|uniref:Mitochondrial assembly of ribosomal large subunit protein 1 n=1 Tax=Allacma fusca TaxID=39272 RepID=A0A8J2J5F5_9HEXA|nr:unnamed protein product [Allacma fusca]
MLEEKNKPKDSMGLKSRTEESVIDETANIPQSIAERYSPFEDRRRVIRDVIEEQWDPQTEVDERPETILYERGKTGVFDLQELVDLLEEERAYDICVIKIPKQYEYADYMTIVSVRSSKHMFALATFVRKRFKSKKLKDTDILPRIEGNKDSKDWIAIDLGNIILHIFNPDFREAVDLETLWTVGPQYDDLCNRKDSDIVELLNMFQ